MEGHPVLEGKVQKRDFFGLPKSELESIASKFESQEARIDRIEGAETPDEFDQAVLDTIADLEDEIGSGG
jgi:hypothetical protein